MQLVNLICRLLVGGLFIFSGLIKLNDPYGTAYKLKEYFEVFAADFSPAFLKLAPASLFFSISISAAEVILGCAIILYYRMRITMWISLAIIIFFTFLTFYSFAFDKVQECGCFGTAIRLTALSSFIKDLILSALILVLFFQRKKLTMELKTLDHIIIILSAILSFGLGFYTKEHLPIIEPTAYKVGNDLKILTKPKEKARYLWVLEKGGKEYSFDDEHYPTDTSYKYKRHVLLTDSAMLVPEVVGFRVYNDDGDFTDEALKGNKFFIIIVDPAEALSNCDKDCSTKMNALVKKMEAEGMKTMILTVPSETYSFEDYRHEVQLSGDYFYMDDTVLKTMVRSNPGFVMMQNGVIKGKWHYNDIEDIGKLNP
ncbi:MAG: DoxX family protein [Cytophagaceae bacterium]|nr:DoxX family protein [Cytophagaceae bacterium]